MFHQSTRRCINMIYSREDWTLLHFEMKASIHSQKAYLYDITVSL